MALALLFCAPFVAIGLAAISGRFALDRLDHRAAVRDTGRG